MVSEETGRKDWNDLHRLAGLGEVRRQLFAAVEAWEASEMGSVTPIAAAKPALDADATHHEIAAHWLASCGQGAPQPVGCEGHIWQFDDNDGLWRRLPLERVEVELGRAYSHIKLCRRKSDYAQIARHAYSIANDPGFFDQAPAGFASPAGFHHLSGDAIVCEPLKPHMRQRFAVDVAPRDIASPVWDEFLDVTFASQDIDAALAQLSLAQEVFGAAVAGLLHPFERAVFLIGPGGTGKSTFLRILEAIVPREFICAVSPFKWDDEYHVAAMAGKRLNLVGELPGDKPIPAHAFKLVTGRDRMTGRLPYGRPFDFRPTAGHVLNSNHFIATRDHDSGFWRRWVVLGFDNPVPESERDNDLDRRVIERELPAVLHWALEGAARVVRNRGFTDSPRGRDLVERWRRATDAVAEFLQDDDAIELNSEADVSRVDLYSSFRDWAKENGRKVMGRSQFFSRVEHLGYRAKKVRGLRMFEGIRIK